MKKLYFLKHNVYYKPGIYRNDYGYRLAKELGAKIIGIRDEIPRKEIENGDILIVNWGVSGYAINDFVINQPTAVKKASNKLHFFSSMAEHDVPTLPACTERLTVANWLFQGHSVYARHKINSHSGKGIQILVPPTAEERNLVHSLSDYAAILPKCKLYTREFKKVHEFRVHVMGGEVIDYVQKRRVAKGKREEQGIALDNQIRTHGNGWIYARNDIYINDYIKDLAVSAMSAVGLDFGAVDILAGSIKTNLNPSVVCEINTSPGLDGETTFNNYLNGLKNLIAQRG